MIKELIDYEPFCDIQPAPVEPVGNPDEVTVQDMKNALENPSLGIKVIVVREADEYEIAKADGVPLLPLSQINGRFTEFDPNQHYYIICKPACVRAFAQRGILPANSRSVFANSGQARQQQFR